MQYPRAICLAIALLPALGACTRIPDYPTSLFSRLDPGPAGGPGSQPSRQILWPDDCRSAAPPSELPVGGGLPPGCANAYNLLMMAEREDDLLRGRRLGPAAAAPSARAAQKYLYGGEGPLGAGIADSTGAGVSLPVDERSEGPAQAARN
jgi:hypothetical protein